MTGARSRTDAAAQRRRKAVLATLACGLVTTAGCLLVNALAGSPVEWFWLVVVPLFVMVLIGAYLWVRLTPSA